MTPPRTTRLPEPPRLRLAHLPTPVEPLSRLTAELGGTRVDIKRDDQTGILLSGNKVRKLEFILAEALDRGATCLITCGGVQSNHARAVAAAGARLGLRSVLLLRDTGPAHEATGSTGAGGANGNLFLDQLLGAEILPITAQEYEERDRAMQDVAQRLRARGEIPWVIPEGGSNALGAWGYVSMLEELVEQRPEFPWDTIVCAVGSGGTMAGLLIGCELLGLSVKIRGYSVHRTADYFVCLVVKIATEFSQRFNCQLSLREEEVEIQGGFAGPGYALTYPQEVENIRRLARTEGIALDPVYTGKAFTGMLDDIRSGKIGAGERVLFLHTGGIFGLMADRLGTA